LEDAIKTGRVKLEFSDMEDIDLDGIVGSLDTKGVTELIKELKNLDDKNVFPIFDKKNYWNHVKVDMKKGDFSRLEDYIPFIFDEKDSEGNYITHPIETEEDFKIIQNRIEAMWRQ
jgi:hypothetical protein